MSVVRRFRALAVRLSAVLTLLALTALAGRPQVSAADVQDVQSASAAAPEISSSRKALRTGIGLERSHQWLKAVRHYEKALKQWPDNEEIRYGLRRSKIHFSIARRYLDRSFKTSLLTKSKTEALDLFDEVLAQVQASYAEPISSTSFVAHGTESLYLAMKNERFIQQQLQGVSRQNIRRFRTMLRERYWNKPVAHRNAARQTVADICDRGRNMLGLSPAAVVMEYIFGGCNALDDYSNVLTPHRLEDLYGNIDGEFVGLGIEMKAEPGRGMLLVNVLPDSPAMEEGLKRGEHIVAINGKNCRRMTTDAASDLLRGTSGSKVRLTIESADGSRTRTREFVRRAVDIDSITVAEMIDRDNGIAYIQMNGFQKNTAAEMDRSLQKLRRQGMRVLIWDLRGNPGGLLTAAVEVLDRFIDNGKLVSTRGRTRDQNWTYSARSVGTWDVPIVLLVDGDSASASEIVAGAIRDHRRGTIVGRSTFGKWSVQSIFPLNSRLGLRLTTAKFYSPNGHTLGKVGVKPDVVVNKAPKHLVRYRAPQTEAELRNDPDLHRAIEISRERYTQR